MKMTWDELEKFAQSKQLTVDVGAEKVYYIWSEKGDWHIRLCCNDSNYIEKLYKIITALTEKE